MSGGILHNKGYFVACRVFETQGDAVLQLDQYNCIVFKVEEPGMMSGRYRGPMRIGGYFLIPETEGGSVPALYSSPSEALKEGMAMYDKNSW